METIIMLRNRVILFALKIRKALFRDYKTSFSFYTRTVFATPDSIELFLLCDFPTAKEVYIDLAGDSSQLLL